MYSSLIAKASPYHKYLMKKLCRRRMKVKLIFLNTFEELFAHGLLATGKKCPTKFVFVFLSFITIQSLTTQLFVQVYVLAQ